MTSLRQRVLPKGRIDLMGVSGLIALYFAVSTAAAGDLLHLRLHAVTVVTTDVVKVRDIGRVTGPNPTAVARLQDLDLSAASPEGDGELIGRDRICVRLLLAGYDGNDVAITGPSTVQVHYGPRERSQTQLDSATVEAAAQVVLATTFNVHLEDVEVRLATPLATSIQVPRDTITIDVLPPVNPQPGRMRLTIRVFSGPHLQQVTTGSFDVRLRQQVVQASASLPVGAVLNAASVTYQTRWATRREYFPPQQSLRQWRVKRPIQAGETITAEDLLPTVPEEENPIVIKSRDIIQLVANGKGLRATVPAAEALEDGRVGDTIRVKNLHSQRVVVGQVTSAQQVEVRF